MEKVLVIYYSKDGHTEKFAEKIRGMLKADIHKIEVEDSLFNMPHEDFENWAQKQAQKQEWPKIKDKPLNLAPYDTIFVGSPVWWYSISMPIVSFLLKTDFQGKTVIPFGTVGGEQWIGKFFENFEEYAKNAKVVRGAVYEESPLIDKKITDWISGLE
ncbi:MAG: NAD(P)H-dependent oxidoreductase [Puniceicoccales bacterium]|nr:NAD(P)H-dependent oxidoreductase [Puniceicoccales bacterium]